MKKYLVLVFALSLISPRALFAEEATNKEEAPAAPAVAAPSEVPTAASAEMPMETPAALETSQAVADVAAPVATSAVTASENLEFVSGEVTGIDEAAKTVTLKLYGDTEDATNDKVLTVTLDASTDVTDGEKDRDLKSLTAGTEVDVEYDAATNKATYIFVY